MEIKKSKKADLETGRGRRFLMGLLLAGAMLAVALEYTITPTDPLDDPDLLARFDADQELAPLMQPDRQLMALTEKKPEPTTRLKIAEEETEEDWRKPEEPLEGDASTTLPVDEEEGETLPPPTDDGALSLRVVEDLPQFPGGPIELMKWLTQNLRYPPAAERQKLQGKVVAEFIVNEDGSVTDVKIVHSLNTYCDREALRVLRMMPRWTAGIDHGQPCRTKVCIPIVFKM